MRILGVLAAAVVLAIPVAAQDKGDLIRCYGIGDDSKRVACYDEVVRKLDSASLREAEAKRKEEVAKIERKRKIDDAKAAQEKFGVETVPMERRADVDLRAVDRPDQLDAKVAEVLTDQLRNVVLLLDNGQMWKQSQSTALPPIRRGDAVRIKRGVIGGYRITLLKSGRAFEVQRMR